jgi:hypothetical protein
MTKQEFSYQFDVLYNNETSNQAPNLNEYEKSVFATKAEFEILKNYLRINGNPKQEGFDDSSKRQIDFSKLLSETTQQSFPENALVILRETIEEDGKLKIVVPLSNEEYMRLLSKPYGKPLKNQVWRLTAEDGTFTLIGHDNTTLNNYAMTYIKNPNPIILWEATDTMYSNFTIEGEPHIEPGDTDPTFPDINVPDELMQEILQRAVELAKIAWQGDLSATLTGGQRSE